MKIIAHSKVKFLLGASAFAGALAFGTGSVSADTYTVKSGDTLNKIAQSHNTTIEEIANQNSIQNVNLIYVDEVFNINVALPSTSTEETAQTENTNSVATSTVIETPTSNSGSVHDRFISAGGTEAMWNTIVLPESGGNPDITSPNGYHGLGQTMQSWGYGSVETQTAGMIAYANSRYGSIENAISFRLTNHWW